MADMQKVSILVPTFTLLLTAAVAGAMALSGHAESGPPPTHVLPAGGPSLPGGYPPGAYPGLGGPPGMPQDPDIPGPRSSVEEVRKLVNPLLVDVRGAAAFRLEHLKGAISIPSSELLMHLDQLPRDRNIVFYCTCPNEHLSAMASSQLVSKGYPHAVALIGGLAAWKAAGLPITRDPSDPASPRP